MQYLRVVSLALAGLVSILGGGAMAANPLVTTTITSTGQFLPLPAGQFETYSSNSPVNGGPTVTAGPSSICVVSGTTVTPATPQTHGSCSITVSQAAGTVSGTDYTAATLTDTIFFKATQTITYPGLADTNFTRAPPELVATSDSGLQITYFSLLQTGEPALHCTVDSTGTITFLSVGRCWIFAQQTGTTDYFPTPDPPSPYPGGTVTNLQAFNILKNTDKLYFSLPKTTPLNTPGLTAQATADSGTLPPPEPQITYVSQNMAVCTVAPSASNPSAADITLLSLGNCTITASKAGTANYYAAAPVSSTTQITANASSISFVAPPNPLLSAGSVPLSAVVVDSITGVQVSPPPAIAFSSTTPAICQVSGASATFQGTTGVCTITAAAAASGLYAAPKPVTVSFNVAGNPNLITFPPLANTPLDGTAPVLAATAASGGAVTYTTNSATICGLTSPSGPITLNATGVCSITASSAATGQFGVATPVTKTFQVQGKSNLITFAQPGDTPFTSPPPTLVATAKSPSPAVTFSSNSAAVCAVSPAGVIKLIGAGTCSISANQPGDAVFAPASTVTRTFAVTPGVNTITFPALASTPIRNVAPTTAATASSGLPVSYASTTAAVCTVTTNGVIRLLTPGTCTVVATQAGNANFVAAAPQQQSFVVTGTGTNIIVGANAITFPVLPNTPFGGTPPVPAATATSTLPPIYSTTSPTICTVTSAGVIKLVSGGSCSITANEPGNASFAAAQPVTRVFLITPGSNVITFPQLPNTAFTSPPPVLTATATSGQPVSFVSNSLPVCKVDPAGLIKFVSGGVCSITASQAASSSWAAAVPVIRTFNVTGGNNVITFPQPPATPFTSTPPTLTATASSSLAVSYVSNSATVCTVTTGGALTFVGGGNCSITASQPGNASYAAATPVTQVFAVQPGTNVISFVQPAAVVLAGPAPTLTATASSGLAVSYASTTSAVCTVTAGGVITLVTPGQCSIQATQSGNASYAAATPVLQTFTVNNNPTSVALQKPAQPASLLTPVSSSTDLTASSVSPLLGQRFTLTATVVPTPTGGTATFNDGGAALCSNVALSGATATCTTAFTTPGIHTVTATYNGTVGFAASTSPGLQITVADQRTRTAETIGKFLSARNNQILANGPDANRQIDRLIESGAADGTTSTSGVAFGAGLGGRTSLGGDGQASTSRVGGPDAGDVARMRFGGRNTALTGSTSIDSLPVVPGSGIGGLGVGGYGAPGTAGYGVDQQASGGGSTQMGGIRLNGAADGGMRFGFATSLRDMARFSAEADSRKAAAAGLGLSTSPGPVAGARPNPFDIWVEGRIATFREPTFASNQDGHFGLLTAGADYVLNSRLLVGTLVQFDSMSQRSASQATEASGRGWMAGPYTTVRLTDNLFWQSRAAWGQSSNVVSPFQTYSNSFTSERWLASSTLTGRWSFGAWSFRPSASVSYMEDASKSYADTYGAVIPAVTSRLGQVKAGPEIGYSYQVGGLRLEPHVGLQMIWNFAHGTSATNLGQINGDTVGSTGARGRAEFGLRAIASKGLAVDVSGSYDGIGSPGYEALTGKATVRVPLN